MRERARGRALAIIGTILGAMLLAAIVLVAGVIFAFGGFRINQAESEFAPMARKIAGIGGVKLCDNGDNGYGIDNAVPWYQAYYAVSDGPRLTAKIKAIAAEQGYQLKVNRALISELKESLDQCGGDRFNSKSDYLVAQNGKRRLTVTINRKTVVTMACLKDYGKRRATGKNEAILDMSLDLPAIQR